MTFDERERILRRIRACLRLAGSPEPHEAAAALRQAQVWMRRYGFTRVDVELESAEVASGSRALVPRAWIATLITVVAGAFAVHPVYAPVRRREARVEFIGRGDAATVAAYAYQVLRRQLVRGRSHYLRGLSRRLKRTTRVRRAELWCEGWVAAVADRVRDMARGLPPREDVERWLAERGRRTDLVATARRRMRGGEVGALLAGEAAGADAVLHHGVPGAGAAAQLPRPA